MMGYQEMLVSATDSANTRGRMKSKRPSFPTKRTPTSAPAQTEITSAEAARELTRPRNPWLSGRGLMLQSMIFLSGFACLVYQILWMRQLGLVFGNTSHAAALTLAVFFGGLAGGSWFWGRRSQSLANPLRTYGWLELGIGLAGVAVLAAPKACLYFYPMLYGKDGSGFALLSFKLLWTLIMVFPPAFLMGGTIPVLGQCLVSRQAEFGTTTARIYAVNTIGAACGAFTTAFVLIGQLGYQQTCTVAISISALAGLLAFVLSRQQAASNSSVDTTRFAIAPQAETANPPTSRKRKNLPSPPVAISLSRKHIGMLAFLSGFNILALEVLWTRMFAQVHENTVYSFSTVLIIVLVCLSLGAYLASRLARSSSSAPRTLVILLTAGGAALSISPFIFMAFTDNLRMLPSDTTFANYAVQLFITGFATIGLPSLLLGTVFPFLMKGEEQFATHPGKSIGRLSAINTIGAILGSLACGFLLLHWLGMWRSMQLLAASYLIVALLIPVAKDGISRAKIGAFILLILSFTLWSPGKLPTTAPKDTHGKAETLLEKWEASDCSVSVVKNTDEHLLIKINSNYTLGSTEAYGSQVFQARIPLLVYPKTDSVFFLGMGTGITAGEALNRDDFKHIEKVVTCELSPSVVAASKKCFTGKMGGPDLTNGLYHDPRSRVLVEDGRNHLMATREDYAMINADLFLPYRRGTGNLYSLEHFQQVKNRLKPGGIFVQWLPLYQISENEFGIIARTMLTAFPQVSLWRGNFQPGAEMVALIGHHDATPIPASDLEVEREKYSAIAGATYRDMLNLMLPINPQTILFFYCGNLTLAKDLFDGFPLNTDDKPIIEFATPRSLHQSAESGKPHFVGGKFADLVDKIQLRTPPDSDPLLASRSPSSRELVHAGSAFHRGSIACASGDEKKWEENWQQFLKHWIQTDARN